MHLSRIIHLFFMRFNWYSKINKHYKVIIFQCLKFRNTNMKVFCSQIKQSTLFTKYNLHSALIVADLFISTR